MYKHGPSPSKKSSHTSLRSNSNPLRRELSGRGGLAFSRATWKDIQALVADVLHSFLHPIEP